MVKNSFNMSETDSHILDLVYWLLIAVDYLILQVSHAQKVAVGALDGAVALLREGSGGREAGGAEFQRLVRDAGEVRRSRHVEQVRQR